MLATLIPHGTSLADATCPVARALDVIGDWWSLLIIRDAFEGVRRFGDFQSGLGIAKGVLATRLRDLVARGVLGTQPASDGSAYRDYVLTARGKGLFLVVVALRQWGEDHMYRRDEPHSLLIDAATNQRVERLDCGHVRVGLLAGTTPASRCQIENVARRIVATAKRADASEPGRPVS